MNKAKLFIIAFFAALMSFMALGAMPALAAPEDELCTDNTSLLPKQVCQIFNSTAKDPAGFVTNRVRFGLVVALGVVVLVAVIFSIIAAIKYISSQGDESKVESAKKSVANILIGLAVLFIAFVGIILIFTIFGVTPTDPKLCNACLTAPESEGCNNFIDNGDTSGCG